MYDRIIGISKGLKPTYEEWKHIKSRNILSWYGSLKPTYEEWKRSDMSDSFIKTLEFKAYLWGMET